ncbi:hypothetical protein GQ54DRAFT_264080 [Martensiomyces pterosporus]|nr:hypothetical protein GQ54DRAFT_264080 [Martensiomyces pterosporus]
MSGTWLHLRGLPPDTAPDDIKKLACSYAIAVKVESVSAAEARGKCLVSSMAKARHILRISNYTKLPGGYTAKISLGPEDLKHCKQIVVPELSTGVTEDDLHLFCKKYGLVCSINVSSGRKATVWFRTQAEANDAAKHLRMSKLWGGGRAVYVGDSDSSSDVIMLDAANTPSAHAAVPVADRRGASLVGKETVQAPPENASNGSTAPAEPSPHSGMRPSMGVARKSTGGRSSLLSRRLADRKGVVVSMSHGHIGNAKNGGVETGTTPKPASPAAHNNGASPVLGKHKTAKRPRYHQSKRVRDIFNMDEWRAKAPFIYEFIYRQLPDVTSGLENSLSMTWCTNKQTNMLEMYSSQGNSTALQVVNGQEVAKRGAEDARSTITMSSFDVPPRGSASNMLSTLDAFNSNEVRVLQKNRQKDDNLGAINALKLYDDGSILFGCSMRSVLVWSTEVIKQKETLLLIDDVDGIYDVGKDHVVANSRMGEMGVWKSGSRNYMWRYNDTRKFRGSPLHSASPTAITALRVAVDDGGAFIGDSSRNLSFSDFREPYMRRLSSTHRGIIRCIEPVNRHGIIIGTDEGYLGLLDTRYMRSSGQTAAVSVYELPTSKPVARIKVCPHDANVFACSVNRNVYIYNKQPKRNHSLLFCHEAHQTPVVDFSWHPDREFMYSIGSLETGEGRGSGEFQIWRPSDIAMYGSDGV